MKVGANDPRASYLIGIGIPLSKYDFGFLKECRKPLLLVHGTKDEFGDVEAVRSMVKELERHTEVQLVVVANADHFFGGHLDELKRAITKWVEEKLST